MIEINIEKDPLFYIDYEMGLEFLKNIDYNKFNYPENITLFHIYSEIKNEKELESVKSFFATQNLNKSKLIIWSDYDIINHKELQDFVDYIDFRIYNPVEESIGTPLEGKIEYLLAKDKKYYLQSDLLRLLVLYKYGGIWIDMDVILLRDFKPLMDQEFLYQWGGDVDFIKNGCCGTVMSLKKESILAEKFLNEIINQPMIGECTIWGKDLFARVYENYKFNILPSSFFNTEWLISKTNVKLSDDVLEFWFENKCPDNLLFLDSLSWHWHNSSNKDKKIIENSKFDKLRKINSDRISKIFKK